MVASLIARFWLTISATIFPARRIMTDRACYIWTELAKIIIKKASKKSEDRRGS